LIVPGLVPSHLGEVVNYAPSWVEVSITLGILALGIFVVLVLLKPALMIEQRYEAGNRSKLGCLEFTRLFSYSSLLRKECPSSVSATMDP
jgi:hypothetical protein